MNAAHKYFVRSLTEVVRAQRSYRCGKFQSAGVNAVSSQIEIARDDLAEFLTGLSSRSHCSHMIVDILKFAVNLLAVAPTRSQTETARDTNTKKYLLLK